MAPCLTWGIDSKQLPLTISSSSFLEIKRFISEQCMSLNSVSKAEISSALVTLLHAWEKKEKLFLAILIAAVVTESSHPGRPNAEFRSLEWRPHLLTMTLC